MEELYTDVLVIGSGLAGIVSAIEAEKSSLRVLITGKFTIGMGTNSSLANGAFTAANSHFSAEDHLQTTIGENLVSNLNYTLHLATPNTIFNLITSEL